MAPLHFRYWHKSKKRMLCYENDVVPLLDNGVAVEAATIMLNGNPQTIMTNVSMEYEVMQSTGLKDKNGKEIFEGDICKYFMDSCWKIGNIFWQRGGWGMRVTKMGIKSTDCVFEFQHFIPTPQDGNQMNDEFEIIGNIYENPDFLK